MVMSLSPLTRLYRRGALTEQHLAEAERLAWLWRTAEVGTVRTVDLEKAGGGVHPAFRGSEAGGVLSLLRAEKLRTSDQWLVLTLIVRNGMTVSDAMRQTGRDYRWVVKRLKDGLTV